ncbi:hypothetical protein WJX75_008176 [Coccomyxa subellipsoidea]|uniref:Amino acid transporter transmembrane domain-containing protein n=1 Tax=Coccomyxa subellipsoidea TaxID=248742 RepID=A0ABR2YSB9_9CHLO
MGVAANQPGLVPEVKAASEIFKPNLVIEKPATLISGNSGGTPPLKWLHHAKALFTEGHTAWDCLLSVACAQIGQVMLTMPHSMALLGISEGIVVTLVAAIAGLWTMFLLVSLYLEMKARQIKAGQWYDASGHRRQVTQYHEVMGYFGGPILKYVSQLLIAVHLIGTGTSQVIACAGNNYSIDQSHSKRWYALVWGGILMLFTFVPTFRHFRVINIVALVGTAYTAWYIVTEAGIKGITPGAITRQGSSAAHCQKKCCTEFYDSISCVVQSFSILVLKPDT